MELLALITAGAAMVTVRANRQKEAELAARENGVCKTEEVMGQEVVAEKGTVWTVTNPASKTNILVGGRLRLSCGRLRSSRKVYILLAVNTVPSRFPYVS